MSGTQDEICKRIATVLASKPIHDHLGYEALAYLKLPGPDYLDLLRTLHAALKPKLYVEIGVRRGDSLRQAAPETSCVGIDKVLTGEALELAAERATGVMLAQASSDDFFAREPNRERVRGFDLALIDGDHSFAQAARDFENLERLAKPTSIICLHDVIPMDDRTATPECKTSFWTGDVWKLMATIVTTRDDLVAFTVACPPVGLGIVGRFGERAIPPLPSLPWPRLPPWHQQQGLLNLVDNAGPAIGRAFLQLREAA